METDRRLSGLDTIHAALRALVAELMGPSADPHELTEMVNALFGLDLATDAIVSSPTAAALATSIETAWFDAGGTVPELVERLAALVDDE